MAGPKDRPERQESLPFPPTPSARIAGRTMQKSVYKHRWPRRLPAEAPNILIAFIDDAGSPFRRRSAAKCKPRRIDRIVHSGTAEVAVTISTGV
jgi:hypothetical protein